jgi:hypothetical protein
MFQTKVLEEIEPQVLGSETFFFKKNHVFFKIMWKHIVQ